ncbi:uncharacterized protein ACRADG_003551 [Cochliomyia hominivorax]
MLTNTLTSMSKRMRQFVRLVIIVLKNRLCNLRLHMRRLHDIELQVPDIKITQKPPSPQPYDENKIKAVLQLAKRKMNEQLQFSDGKRSKHRLYIKMDKETVIRSVIGLVVEDGLSPHIFSSKHMDNILRPICEAISEKEGKKFKINEAEIERIISLIANYIRNDFSNDLHWRLLSIRIDTDLNASPNTFCVSAQFIDDGEIKTHMLGIIHLEDDGQLKEEHIKHILYKFNIDSNQVISAFWDHTKSKYKLNIKNSDYLHEIEQYEFYPDLNLGDVQITRYFGQSAQMCLLDILQNSTIYKSFLECRNMAKFLSEVSNGYYEIFEKNNLNIPQLDSPWKWGSTYKMMKDLHEARNILQNVKFENFDNSEEQFDVNDQLWSFIEAFCNSLTYLQKSILKYHKEELHIGDFYAQWLKCKLLTEKLLTANSEENSVSYLILTELLDAMKKRSNNLLNQERFVACIYLDPRFQRTLNEEQKSNAVEYLKKLWSRAKLYNTDESDTVEAAAELFDDDEDAFLNEFLSHDIQVKDTKTNDVYQKIERLKLTFQMVDTNILSYWRSQKSSDPEMHAISTICFAIPATEIYNKTRYLHIYRLDLDSNLSTFTKENLLNIRLNAHLLDDALAHLQLSKEDGSNLSCYSDGDIEVYDLSEDDNSNTKSTLTAKSATVNNTANPSPVNNSPVDIE